MMPPGATSRSIRAVHGAVASIVSTISYAAQNKRIPARAAISRSSSTPTPANTLTSSVKTSRPRTARPCSSCESLNRSGSRATSDHFRRPPVKPKSHDFDYRRLFEPAERILPIIQLERLTRQLERLHGVHHHRQLVGP